MDGIEEKSRPDLVKWFFIALLVIAGLAVIGGGIFVYQKALNSKKPEITPTPTLNLSPTLTLTTKPEASPSPELNRNDLKIKILNGTGIPGVAGKASHFLEKLGYGGIKTGNADSFDYKKTTIQIKESKKKYTDLLVGDLAKNYSLNEKRGILPEEENFDVIIILGKD